MADEPSCTFTLTRRAFEALWHDRSLLNTSSCWRVSGDTLREVRCPAVARTRSMNHSRTRRVHVRRCRRGVGGGLCTYTHVSMCEDACLRLVQSDAPVRPAVALNLLSTSSMKMRQHVGIESRDGRLLRACTNQPDCDLRSTGNIQKGRTRQLMAREHTNKQTRPWRDTHQSRMM